MSLAFMIFLSVVIACFGAVMGSFLNCAAYRIVRGESFVTGRSKCPACGHTLTARELIPVISWAIQRGRCRACGAKVSIRYPLTELAFALVTLLCAARFGLTVLCARNYVFLCCLFLLTLTDLEDMIIPDGCHIVAVLAWLVALPFISSGEWGRAALSGLLSAAVFGGGLLVISLVMDRVLGRDSMGGGDIKLFAVVGLYLGIIGTLGALILACVLGLAFHAMQRGKERAFPFGPAIAAAAALMLLYGQPLVDWYRALIGLA